MSLVNVGDLGGGNGAELSAVEVAETLHSAASTPEKNRGSISGQAPASKKFLSELSPDRSRLRLSSLNEPTLPGVGTKEGKLIDQAIAVLRSPAEQKFAEVCIRARPLLQHELEEEDESIWHFSRGKVVRKGRDGSSCFAGHVFGPEEKTETVYSKCVAPTVRSVVAGKSSTILLYGESGTGKTHTLMGSGETTTGVLSLSLDALFAQLSDNDSELGHSSVTMAYYEVHGELVSDLLSNSGALSPPRGAGLEIQSSRNTSGVRMSIVDDPEVGGVRVDGLAELEIESTADCIAALTKAERHRAFILVRTDVSHCSRASTVLKITVHTPSGPSSLSIFDMASASRLDGGPEGGSPTRGLRVLRHVVRRLNQQGQNVSESYEADKAEPLPFRNSKVTRLLRSTFEDGGALAVVCTMSPGGLCEAASRRTLYFASQMASITTASVAASFRRSSAAGAPCKLQRQLEMMQLETASMLTQLKHADQLVRMASRLPLPAALLHKLQEEQHARLLATVAAWTNLQPHLNTKLGLRSSSIPVPSAPSRAKSDTQPAPFTRPPLPKAASFSSRSSKRTPPTRPWALEFPLVPGAVSRGQTPVPPEPKLPKPSSTTTTTSTTAPSRPQPHLQRSSSFPTRMPKDGAKMPALTSVGGKESAKLVPVGESSASEVPAGNGSAAPANGSTAAMNVSNVSTNGGKAATAREAEAALLKKTRASVHGRMEECKRQMESLRRLLLERGVQAEGELVEDARLRHDAFERAFKRFQWEVEEMRVSLASVSKKTSITARMGELARMEEAVRLGRLRLLKQIFQAQEYAVQHLRTLFLNDDDNNVPKSPDQRTSPSRLDGEPSRSVSLPIEKDDAEVVWDRQGAAMASDKPSGGRRRKIDILSLRDGAIRSEREARFVEHPGEAGGDDGGIKGTSVWRLLEHAWEWEEAWDPLFQLAGCLESMWASEVKSLEALCLSALLEMEAVQVDVIDPQREGTLETAEISWTGPQLGLLDRWSCCSMGDNRYGQLGFGPPGANGLGPQHVAPQVLKGAQPWLVAASWRNTLVVTSDHQMVQLGVRDMTEGVQGKPDRRVPALHSQITYLPMGQHKVMAIACGWQHSLAVSHVGAVFSWGFGGYGSLGHGNKYSCTKPQLVESLLGKLVQGVATGSYSSFAVTESGGLLSWGWGKGSQLGLGGSGENVLLPSLVLVDSNSSKLPPVKKIRGGHLHTCLLTCSGEIFSAGLGKNGRLGYPCVTEESRFRRLEKTAANEDVVWMQDIDCGFAHTAAIDGNGRVLTCGAASCGALGHGRNVMDQNFLRTVEGVPRCSLVACGGFFTACVDEGGALWTFGRNEYHQLARDCLFHWDGRGRVGKLMGRSRADGVLEAIRLGVVLDSVASVPDPHAVEDPLPASVTLPIDSTLGRGSIVSISAGHSHLVLLSRHDLQSRPLPQRRAAPVFTPTISFKLPGAQSRPQSPALNRASSFSVRASSTLTFTPPYNRSRSSAHLIPSNMPSSLNSDPPLLRPPAHTSPPAQSRPLSEPAPPELDSPQSTAASAAENEPDVAPSAAGENDACAAQAEETAAEAEDVADAQSPGGPACAEPAPPEGDPDQDQSAPNGRPSAGKNKGIEQLLELFPGRFGLIRQALKQPQQQPAQPDSALPVQEQAPVPRQAKSASHVHIHKPESEASTVSGQDDAASAQAQPELPPSRSSPSPDLPTPSQNLADLAGSLDSGGGDGQPPKTLQTNAPLQCEGSKASGDNTALGVETAMADASTGQNTINADAGTANTDAGTANTDAGSPKSTPSVSGTPSSPPGWKSSSVTAGIDVEFAEEEEEADEVDEHGDGLTGLVSPPKKRLASGLKAQSKKKGDSGEPLNMTLLAQRPPRRAPSPGCLFPSIDPPSPSPSPEPRLPSNPPRFRGGTASALMAPANPSMLTGPSPSPAVGGGAPEPDANQPPGPSMAALGLS